MGELARIDDIRIKMYPRDVQKHKEPHFHVILTDGSRVSVAIANGRILEGKLNKRQRDLLRPGCLSIAKKYGIGGIKQSQVNILKRLNPKGFKRGKVRSMQSPDILQAEVLNDHKMRLSFNNGEQRIFDMKPYLDYPVFRPLKDQAEFNRFEIVDGTIEWKCGADLSQDTFYLESVPASEVNAMG